MTIKGNIINYDVLGSGDGPRACKSRIYIDLQTHLIIYSSIYQIFIA